MKVISTLIEAHIFRRKKNSIEFLLLKRSPDEIYPGLWQMVTGSIRPNEKAYQTALREIKEETSLVPSEIWVVPTINSFYSHEKNYVCLVPVFAALVEHINFITISKEHSEYKWVNTTTAKKLLAWKGQRDSVDLIHNYFLKEQSTLNFIKINFS